MAMLSLQQRMREAMDILKERDIRITPQRQAVLEYLVEYQNHPTADDIYRALEMKFPNMSVATVYNNLRVLKDVGLLTELTYGDSSSRFDYFERKHYHITCEECGKIVNFEISGLEEAESKAEMETGFDITHHRMELYGYCPSCKGRKNRVAI